MICQRWIAQAAILPRDRLSSQRTLEKRARNKEHERDPDEAQPAIVSVGGG